MKTTLSSNSGSIYKGKVYVRGGAHFLNILVVYDSFYYTISLARVGEKCIYSSVYC